jgi:hypothetical protein
VCCATLTRSEDASKQFGFQTLHFSEGSRCETSNDFQEVKGPSWQQFIGDGLTARLSHRLGEGLVNGGFTIRIGIAAVELLRPLPYIEARKPRLCEFMAEFSKFG